MKIFDYFKRVVSSRKNLILQDKTDYNFNLNCGCLPFGDVIFINIVEILTDLINDVELVKTRKGDALDFAFFKKFISLDGKTILNRTFTDGYVVIKLPSSGLSMTGGYRILSRNEFTLNYDEFGRVIVKALNYPDDEIYVIKSDVYREYGKSDKELLLPYIKFIDNLLNSSNTLTERFGVLVVASPKNLTSQPTSIILTEEEKNELEEDMAKNYGSLSRQKQVMLLPREMSFQQINLSAVDQKIEEKLKLAVEAIADRIKVPSNKISLIDANQSQALANGSEISKSDLILYKSFERLLNQTIIRMADDLGFPCTYTIYNKKEE